MQTQSKSTKAGTTKSNRRAAKPEQSSTKQDAAQVEETKGTEVEQVATAQGPAKAEKAPKVLPTPEEALATAKAENPTRYAHVLRVVEQTKDGSPKRVVVACTDKQHKQAPDGSLVSGCTGEREIATQDLFQVDSCAWCADRKVRKARRNRAKAKDKALRAAARAMVGRA